jgi:hypothetical protein
MYEEAL